MPSSFYQLHKKINAKIKKNLHDTECGDIFPYFKLFQMYKRKKRKIQIVKKNKNTLLKAFNVCLEDET